MSLVRGTLRFLAIPILLLILSIPAFSQSGSTGVITGRSTDNSGAVVPGVEVAISSPAMIGGTRQAVTDEAGAYRFTQLVPGTYRVSFSLPGFKTLNIDGVAITAGATMTILGPMEVASSAEEVTVVSAAPQIDVEDATVGINWGTKKMDDLPWGRSVVSLAQMVPGIYTTNYDVGGNQMGGSSNIGGRVFGRSGGEVRTYDGVAWCMGFDDFGSYEEVQLTAAAKGAEAMSPGVLGTYVVKSGSNTFHGTALASWEDGSFQSNNVTPALYALGFPTGNNNFTRYNDFGFDFGGPILHNKLWFYSAYDDAFTGQNIAGFVTQATNAPAIYPIGLRIETFKLSYQINAKMKLEAMDQVSTKAAPYRNGSSIIPLEATQNQETTTSLGPVLKYTYIISPKMTTDFGIERAGYWWPTVAHTSAPRIVDLTTGETRGAYLASYSRPIRWQWNGSWSWFTDLAGKSNEIKTGFLGWWDKTYNYNSGYPNQELYDYKSTAADIAGCTGITCNYFGRPNQVVTYDYPDYTASVVKYESWYLNDQIHLSKKLTLNAGVRYDHYSDYLPAQGNPGSGPFSGQVAGQGGVPIGPGIASESLYPQISNFPVFHKLVPRISLSYDVRGDGRLALKASYSQYAGGGSSPGSAPGTTGNSVNQAAAITRTYSNWDGSIPYVPVPANLTQVSGGGGIQAISSNLTVPYTTQYTAGAQAGWHKDYLVGFTAVRTFDYGGAEKLNLALPFSAYTLVNCIPDPGRDNVLTGAGGTQHGQNPTGSQVCAWAVPKTYPTFSATNNLYTNYAKGEGTKNYSAFESTFQKQHSRGWSMLFAYTIDFAHINTANQNNFNPNTLVYNWEAPVWNQEYKFNASYDVPFHGVKYSTTAQAQSGAWFGRFVNVPNSNGQTVLTQVEAQQARYPYVKYWDNRISKVFKAGDRNTFEAMFDLYNTLNANTVLSQITTNSATFGQLQGSGGGSISAAPILPARIFKLGMRWKF